MRYTLLLLLAACASIEPSPFKGPNGGQAFHMECSGSGRTLAGCYTKAAELCPAGYLVVGSHSGTVGVPTALGGTIAVPVHELAVECR